MRAEAAPDRCPRCGGGFRCGAADAAPCPCAGVALDGARREQLRARYRGCLCLDCLRAVAAGEPASPPGPQADGRG